MERTRGEHVGFISRRVPYVLPTSRATSEYSYMEILDHVELMPRHQDIDTTQESRRGDAYYDPVS